MFRIDGTSLTIEEVVKAARLKERVEIDENSKDVLDKCAAVVSQFVEEKKVVYGI